MKNITANLKAYLGLAVFEVKQYDVAKKQKLENFRLHDEKQ